MTNYITVLNQIADTVTLYVNCFKNGYTRLCYFYNPASIVTINLTEPRITIDGLTEKKYYFYCLNNQDEEVGHITVPVATASYATFWQNMLSYTDIEEDTNILLNLKEPEYVLDLYKAAVKSEDGIEAYEELLSSCTSFYNSRQESLNTMSIPDFILKDETVISFSGQRYYFIPYVYNLTEDKWEIVPGQERNRTETYTFNGKPSLMYRILVLSDISLVREYFYYCPSKTLSETILERRISTKQQLMKRTAEMMVQFDITELSEDEYGQEVVCALQEMKPEYPILAMPQLTYDEENGLFYGYFPNYNILPFVDYNIYIAALEIDQVYNQNKVPHKILAAGKNFILNPSAVRMNYGEDYIFYLCDKDNHILSMPCIYRYGTETDTELYFTISRKLDLDLYRRRLFNIFKEYDKKDWNTISLILDKYIASEENLYQPMTDYAIEEISRLDTIHFQIDYLIQLVLLNQIKYYLPTDQTFIHEQVYAEEYNKHVFPEAEEPYIIRCGRLDKNVLSWEFIAAGDTSKEIRIDKNKLICLQALNKDMTKTSPYALYHNIYSGSTRYFYYPNLEVTVAHGLY